MLEQEKANGAVALVVAVVVAVAEAAVGVVEVDLIQARHSGSGSLFIQGVNNSNSAAGSAKTENAVKCNEWEFPLIDNENAR